MTVALALKVHDGVVLAADSASTLMAVNPAGELAVLNVYYHANKIVNLYKGKPIGFMTWGAGGIGTASIYTLAKDLRKRLTGEDERNREEWILDPQKYQLKDVADKVREFFFDEHYQTAYGKSPKKPSIGFCVAGYSSDSTHPEIYEIKIGEGNCTAAELKQKENEIGITCMGMGDAIVRLFKGYAPELPSVLIEMGIGEDQLDQAMKHIDSRLLRQMVTAAMPIQDAIDLAIFLVDTTISFNRFCHGPQTVGGPVDVAAITKHEGFKWVKRKYYYESALNP